FMLIAAMNPCPCGYYGDTEHNCQCSPPQLQRYLSRISGPLLDRFDIQLDIPPLKSQELLAENVEAEPSQSIGVRVAKARRIQLDRYRKQRMYSNAQLPAKWIRHYCKLDDACLEMMERAIRKYKLSARAYHRVLKVARTIADLDGVSEIATQHLG